VASSEQAAKPASMSRHTNFLNIHHSLGISAGFDSILYNAEKTTQEFLALERETVQGGNTESAGTLAIVLWGIWDDQK